jgi:hypothetical protein
MRAFATENAAVVSGSEFISTVAVTTSNAVGDVIPAGTVNYVCPQVYSDTRLAIFSTLFEKYEIIEWEIEYVPQCPTTTSGSLYLFFEPDPADTAIGGVNMVRRAVAARGENIAVWQNTRVRYPASALDSTYFTSDSTDLRQSRGGYFAVVAGSTYAANATVGTLLLHYKLRFFKPIIESQGVATTNWSQGQPGGVVSVSAPFGNAPFLTGNNSDFPITMVSGTTISWPINTALVYHVYIAIIGTGLVSGSGAATNGTITVADKATTATIIYDSFAITPTLTPVSLTYTVTGTTVTGVHVQIYGTRSASFVNAVQKETTPTMATDALMARISALEGVINKMRNAQNLVQNDNCVTVQSTQLPRTTISAPYDDTTQVDYDENGIAIRPPNANPRVRFANRS